MNPKRTRLNPACLNKFKYPVRTWIIVTGYSVILFCIVSYFSVMSSLLSSAGNPGQKPTANIGYPFAYYYQFWLRGNNSPNCGWRGISFIAYAILTWVFSVACFIPLSCIKPKKIMSTSTK